MIIVRHGPSVVKMLKLLQDEGVYIEIDDWDFGFSLFEVHQYKGGKKAVLVQQVGGLWVWTQKAT